jgi:hypothetical protein
MVDPERVPNVYAVCGYTYQHQSTLAALYVVALCGFLRIFLVVVIVDQHASTSVKPLFSRIMDLVDVSQTEQPAAAPPEEV